MPASQTPERIEVRASSRTSTILVGNGALVGHVHRAGAEETGLPEGLPVSGGELHSAADRLSSAFRRWLAAEGITFGVC